MNKLTLTVIGALTADGKIKPKPGSYLLDDGNVSGVGAGP